MTPLQIERISQLRATGKSYAAIAAEVRISENTIKSFFRRSGLGAKPADSDNGCDNCGQPLTHTLGAKRRRFCSDACRLSWWNAHPEAVNKKAVYSFVCPVCGAVFSSYGNASHLYRLDKESSTITVMFN